VETHRCKMGGWFLKGSVGFHANGINCSQKKAPRQEGLRALQLRRRPAQA